MGRPTNAVAVAMVACTLLMESWIPRAGGNEGNTLQRKTVSFSGKPSKPFSTVVNSMLVSLSNND